MASHESTPSGCCQAASDTTQPSGASAAALSPEQLSSWGPDIFDVSQHSQGTDLALPLPLPPHLPPSYRLPQMSPSAPLAVRKLSL